MSDTPDQRLEALELKIMEFEVTQNQLDAVLVRQSAEIDALKQALEAAVARLDAVGANAPADTDTDGTELQHELPPHY